MVAGSLTGHKILFGVSLNFVMIKNCRWARGRLSSPKGYGVLLKLPGQKAFLRLIGLAYITVLMLALFCSVHLLLLFTFYTMLLYKVFLYNAFEGQK